MAHHDCSLSSHVTAAVRWSKANGVENAINRQPTDQIHINSSQETLRHIGVLIGAQVSRGTIIPSFSFSWFFLLIVREVDRGCGQTMSSGSGSDSSTTSVSLGTTDVPDDFDGIPEPQSQTAPKSRRLGFLSWVTGSPAVVLRPDHETNRHAVDVAMNDTLKLLCSLLSFVYHLSTYATYAVYIVMLMSVPCCRPCWTHVC